VASDHHAGGFGPGGDERRLQLSDRWTFEAHIRLAPRPTRPAIAEPFVVDAEAAGPSNTPVDDDAADVRTILCEMQGGESDRTEGHDQNPSRPEGLAVARGNVGGTERIIENEDAAPALARSIRICPSASAIRPGAP
jgi:hypothetical protein